MKQLKTDKFYNGQQLQELIGEIPTASKNIGFNLALLGHSWSSAKNECHSSEWSDCAGYFLQAQQLILDGVLFFKRDHDVVKVVKDGNSFCCIGEGFVNLQESDNYAFGDTFEDAISNFKKARR